MTTGIDLDFYYVKNFISSKGYCLLEEERYIKAKDKIRVLCSCKKKDFFITFDHFFRDQCFCSDCRILKNKIKRQDRFREIIDDVERISNYQYVSGEYKDGNTSNLVFTDFDGYLYKCSINQIKNSVKSGGKLWEISKSNPFSLENMRIWLKKDKRKFSISSGEYVSAHKKTINFYCNVCGEYWMGCWANIMSGQGCPYCVGKAVGRKNNFGFLHPELLDEWNYERNSVSPFEITEHSHFYAWWKCELCSYEWQTRPAKRFIYKTCCPKCNSSKGEKMVSEILDNLNISYIPHKSFLDCKIGRKPLQFDFFIDDYGIIIEYQGIQHYQPIDFSGKGLGWATQLFEKNIFRDNFKKDYCKKNRYLLIEIPYTLKQIDVYNLILNNLKECGYGNLSSPV